MGSRFQLPPNGRIRVLSASGNVTVLAEERSDIEVEPAGRTVELKEGGYHRHRHRHRHRHGFFSRRRDREDEVEEISPGGRPVLEVKSKSGSIEVRCPTGTDV